MKLQLRIQRQGVDPTAESSLHALRDLMQLPVLAVEHGELWEFDVDAGTPVDAARAALAKAASRAGRYANLNRDVMIWEAQQSTQESPSTGTGVDVWVCPGIGEDARALQWFQKHSGICRALRRGRWYRVHVQTTDAEEARHLVEDLATSRSRRHGLLANPHTDTVTILGVHASTGGLHVV